MDSGSNLTSTVHFLPCSIDYDGTAPVRSFFHIKSEDDGHLISHLRGRKLKGTISQLETSTSKTAGSSETSNETRLNGSLIGFHLTDNGPADDIARSQFAGRLHNRRGTRLCRWNRCQRFSILGRSLMLLNGLINCCLNQARLRRC